MGAAFRSRVLAAGLLLLAGCSGPEGSDENATLPPGEPPFPALGQSYVLDRAGVLGEATVRSCHEVCLGLKEQGVAEVVVLVQNGVRHPEIYATHYGRWLGLGGTGPAATGGQNGLVWLLRPDGDRKITVSVGRGLPKLTAGDVVAIAAKAKASLERGAWDQAVSDLVAETARTLRKLYGKG